MILPPEFPGQIRALTTRTPMSGKSFDLTELLDQVRALTSRTLRSDIGLDYPIC